MENGQSEAALRYEALSVDTLATRLGDVHEVASRVGGEPESWEIREVGDGNLNLVFIVTGTAGSVVVKQALPYVRMVGESWPLPLYRAHFEYYALVRQAKRAPSIAPEVFYFDKPQALFVMEYLYPHTILRRKLIKGERVARLGETIGQFCARTAFRGSELSLPSPEKKQDVGLFSGNVAIPAITESLVFTDPYYGAEMNHHTPELSPVVDELRRNVRLKAKVQRLLMKFTANTETMLHGDLHSGSIMATDTDVRVIDPEFSQYGPMAFDLGMAVANFLMAYFSQPAHRQDDDLDAYQAWILDVIEACFTSFDTEFCRLWQTERTGILFPRALFEEQGNSADDACDALLDEIRLDALAYCGIEMHRRVLSLAHNADFEEIEDTALRARLEARNVLMGQALIMNPDAAREVPALIELAQAYNRQDVL
ncbi:5-methylthioribose kinase [Halomonas citrativorans]|uniref:S-methyl-5-thioribose kinase n=1 Tax=Halomonas citrativorans TaxID=2742612 RepID=A0A1R4I4E8_9GAMM|nr:S-methyl-5-thioribose kinase [Halomonas citrativorans]SJN14737.1 5-methylthioribose kinase [Halomonas citrativorans]